MGFEIYPKKSAALGALAILVLLAAVIIATHQATVIMERVAFQAGNATFIASQNFSFTEVTLVNSQILFDSRNLSALSNSSPNITIIDFFSGSLATFDINSPNSWVSLFVNTSTSGKPGAVTANGSSLTENADWFWFSGNTTAKVNFSLSLTAQRIQFNFAVTPGPQWYNNTTSVATGSVYSKNQQYQFNFSWIDDASVSNAFIEHNFSGMLANYTLSNQSAVYYHTFSDVPAGTYVFRSYANDSSGVFNATPQLKYTVAKASPSLSLQITPSNSTGFGTTTVATGSLTIQDNVFNATLLRNGTIVNQSTSLTSISDSVQLAALVYNHTFVFNGSQNYSSAFSENMTNISKASSEVSLYLNGTRSDRAYATGQPANITAEVNVTGQTVSIFSNYTGSQVQIASGTTPQSNVTNTSALNLTIYLIKANWTGNQNYSFDEESWLLSVQSVGPPIFVGSATSPSSGVSYSQNASYGFQINATSLTAIDRVFLEANLNTSPSLANFSASCAGPATNRICTMNFTDVPAGSYQYRWVANDTSNNWSATTPTLYSVAQASTTTFVYVNGSRANAQIETGYMANLTAYVSAQKTVVLFANYTGAETQLGNGTQTFTNMTNTSALSSYVYSIKANFSGDANFTSSTESWTLTVFNLAPQITTVSPSPSQNSATITWNTQDHSNSTVYYGISSALGSNSTDSAFVQNHSITLSGLSTGTQYFFNVSSCDPFGLCNSTSQSTFTTTSPTTTTTSGGGGGGGGGGGSGGGGSVTTTTTSTSTTTTLKTVKNETTKKEAEETIQKVRDALARAEAAGVSVDRAREILGQSVKEFDQLNYLTAKALAEQAYEEALKALQETTPVETTPSLPMGMIGGIAAFSILVAVAYTRREQIANVLKNIKMPSLPKAGKQPEKITVVDKGEEATVTEDVKDVPVSISKILSMPEAYEGKKVVIKDCKATPTRQTEMGWWHILNDGTGEIHGFSSESIDGAGTLTGRVRIAENGKAFVIF